jgi:cytochrome P450
MLLQLIARLTSRVFVGPELCANRDWLDVSVNYTVQAFVAAQALHDWPFLLRPLVQLFLPECRDLRRTMARARKVLEPVVAQRRARKEQQKSGGGGGGGSSSKVADMIGWMDEIAKGKPYDVVVCQVGLTLAAIHTTSELLSGIISDLCSHPEWFAPLREEMVAAIGAHGWNKKALNEMKTVDSMMKESQRHHLGDIGKWAGGGGGLHILSRVEQ